MKVRHISAILAATFAAGCDVGEDDSSTLYRSSVLDPAMRVHVATFDSGEGKDYNQQNCDIVTRVFAAQPGVTVQYWCERGRFRRD
jgi:hypothetical protein